MELTFTNNFKLLEVKSSTDLELAQIKKELTASKFDFATRETYETCMFNNYKYIPSGLWQRIYKLKNNKWNVNIDNIDKLIRHDYDLEYFKNWSLGLGLAFPPYEYQIDAVYRAYKYRQSKLFIDTSGGKSLIQYLMARFLLEHVLPEGMKVLLVVPRIMLCGQMEDDFAEYEELMTDKYIKVDKIYGGSKRNKDGNVVVGNIKSLINYDADFFEQFGFVMFDEGHLMGTAKSYQKILHLVPSSNIQQITGLSGTFHTGKSLECLMQDTYLGPTVIRIEAHDLMKQGRITKVKINVIVLHHNKELCKVYYNQDFHNKEVNKFHNELLFSAKIKSRRDIISNVVDKTKGNHILLFTSKKHLHSFKDYYETNYNKDNSKKIYTIHGDIKLKERIQICDEIETTDNSVMFAIYKTMDTGVSIKLLEHLHFIDTSKSFISIVQSIGRTLRLHKNKDVATIWDWVNHFKKHNNEWSGPKINKEYLHSKARQKIYKDKRYEYVIKNINI